MANGNLYAAKTSPKLLLPGQIVTHSTFSNTFPQQCGASSSEPIVLQMLQITAVALALSPILRLTAVARLLANHQKGENSPFRSDTPTTDKKATIVCLPLHSGQ